MTKFSVGDLVQFDYDFWSNRKFSKPIHAWDHIDPKVALSKIPIYTIGIVIFSFYDSLSGWEVYQLIVSDGMICWVIPTYFTHVI